MKNAVEGLAQVGLAVFGIPPTTISGRYQLHKHAESTWGLEAKESSTWDKHEPSTNCNWDKHDKNTEAWSEYIVPQCDWDEQSRKTCKD